MFEISHFAFLNFLIVCNNGPLAVSSASPAPTGGQGWGCRCGVSNPPGSPLLARMPQMCQEHACDDAAFLTKGIDKEENFSTKKKNMWKICLYIFFCMDNFLNLILHHLDFHCLQRGREWPHKLRWRDYWEGKKSAFKTWFPDACFWGHRVTGTVYLWICTSLTAWGSRCWRSSWWIGRLEALCHGNKTPRRNLWW